MVMQKIAVFDGGVLGLSDQLFFKKRTSVEKSKLLYNVLLKDLVNSVVSPDSSAVFKYYDAFKNVKYYEPERVLVRQIKVSTKVLADSLFAVVSQNPSSFDSLASLFSTNRRAEGGLMEPFERGKYNYMGEAAFDLSVGEVFGPIENLDRSFSVILLEGRLPGQPIPFERVYKRIESLLTKEYQEQIKRETFDSYLNNPNLIVGKKYEKFLN
jgi:parvulin-like peptidyl-prolyl isomerase